MNNETDRTISEITEVFKTFHSEMDALDSIASRVAHKTTRLIRVVLSILVTVSMLIFFQVFLLTDDLTNILDQMDEMFINFGKMSSDMGAITKSVNSMGDNIEGIPAIANSMKVMNHDVAGMSQSVLANIGYIGLGTTEMSERFIHLDRAVSHMRYNVGEMSKPTDVLNPFSNMVPR